MGEKDEIFIKRNTNYFIINPNLFRTTSLLSASQGGWFWQNPLPQGNSLLGVSFTDANNGTAVGFLGTILRTTDGGNNWVSQTGVRQQCFMEYPLLMQNGTAVGYRGTS